MFEREVQDHRSLRVKLIHEVIMARDEDQKEECRIENEKKNQRLGIYISGGSSLQDL